jgi:hypothetical protein
MIRLSSVLLFLVACTPIAEAVSMTQSNPIFSNTDKRQIFAECMNAKVRHGHDLRDLQRAYYALVHLYPDYLGMVCASRKPAGIEVIDAFKNPGYMSTPASNEYCYLFFLSRQQQ